MVEESGWMWVCTVIMAALVVGYTQHARVSAFETCLQVDTAAECAVSV